MHTKAHPHSEDPDADTGAATFDDEPYDDSSHAPRRRPIIGLFRRRAFLSKDTGRWHRLTGGRDATDASEGD